MSSSLLDTFTSYVPQNRNNEIVTRKLVRVQSTSDSTEKTTWRALDWSRWRKEKKKEKIIKRQEKKGKEKRTEKEHGELEATKDAGGVVVTLEDRKHGKFVTVNAEPPNRLVDTTREANEKTTGAGYFFFALQFGLWFLSFVATITYRRRRVGGSVWTGLT